ncbi:MAG: hypothetical protein JW903_03835 [Clostridia bacterium]|nr:hypothetical protein [Clostridia bacterium]
MKSTVNTRGTVSAEAAIGSASMILFFAVFISLAGYFVTAAQVKSIAFDKAVESSITMYAADIVLPVTMYYRPVGVKYPEMAKNLVFLGITSEESVKIIASYKYPSIFGDIKTTLSSVCPLWCGDGKSAADEECVWNLAPNERGRRIEQLFGGNLPEFFPIIDSFDFISGEAICILSIDTTLEVYKTENEIRKVIEEEAEKLRNFSSGASGGVKINPNDISSRKLLVVIPQNQLSDDQENMLEDIVFATMDSGIQVEVKRFQIAGQ